MLPTVAPQAREIVGAMKQAESPLDFIRQNLRPTEPQVDPQAIANAEKAKVDEAAQKAAEIPEPTFETEPVKQADPAAAPESELEDPLFADVADTTAENFKKLRTKAKEVTKKAKELESENSTLKSKLTEYETGTVVPEVLQAKETEIQRLSYYEKLVNFKGSKEYQEKFVKPVTELQTRLGEIAKDYEVPEETIQEALTISNRAELNRFLTDHFDEVGALEVKDLVGKIKSIQTEAFEAEKAPSDTLARMQSESATIYEQQRSQRVGTVVNTARGAWVETLQSIQAEANIPELTTLSNNTEHNEKVVKPIRVAAATEYGKIVKMLAESGLEQLPNDLAKALAKSVLLAHASATAIASRGHTAKELQTIATNIKRETSYERPAIGGGVPNGASAQPSAKPNTPYEAAGQLINKVLSQSQR